MAEIGRVHLRVRDLDRLVEFYTKDIGLMVKATTNGMVTLGTAERDLLTLTHRPNGQHYRGTTGLFHMAFLLPSRGALAGAFFRLLQRGAQLQGASDHIVSEALYLADPEGNGIELYRDRPRKSWYKNGQFQLATLPLDSNDLLDARPGDAPHLLPAGTRVGHVHLRVTAVDKAEAFYTRLLDMDVMMNVRSATFLSYDGYHHHLGANTWGGKQLPPPDALGLDHWELSLGSEMAFQKTVARLEAAGHEIEPGRAIVHDPAMNAVALSA